ncbi:putative molybdenum cofactor sulfurtransferase [Helianthus annuus]|nr:putative molybdenum cofactor sulfurtransferase [Helianthus annuus]KAJ0565015.1 putative molybdenum cofactor sulfurtransferase [Helianthus annuus]KAJ0629029.1 putative molybdenum cofactor sulfurtransferase [Helianthus annuus]KAJ0736511.1 putative molybdenum cofactor sulfurtransferase [Helianthus annuus]KAJ0739460.1 putative molybdenum cofactor sulfurtransferase [Helianthus annuus]
MTSPCFRRCCPNQLLGQPGDSEQYTTSRQSRYDFIAATALSLHPNTQFTNHESIPTLDQSFDNMKRAYPNYPETDRADRIRDQEYYQLTLMNHVCLDYNGHGLFSYSQQLHSNATFFNIIYKSANLYLEITRGGQEPEFETKIKERIFRFMNISSDEYSLVFTANQTSAFKVLADSYPFHTNRNLLTVYDHQNEAVETMMESCRKRSGRVDSAVFSWPNMRIQSKKLRKSIVSNNKSKKKKKRGLFVFPLQSKVTGSKYSYVWMSLAQENGWHVCLDANAFGAKDMETLGLSLFRPDFLICSFYKVFGENPSGFGCLFIKKSRSSVVKNSSTVTGLVNIVQAPNRPLFLEESRSIDRGKTVLSSSSSSPSSSSLSVSLSLSKQEISEIQEIGEINEEKKESSFFEIWKRDVAVDLKEKSTKNEASSSGVSSDVEFRGLDHADSLGLILISSRVRYLVNWLVNAFGSLKHPHPEDGVPLVRIYGPKVRVERGPVVAFNVFDWKGEKVEPTLVQKLADRHNISLSYAVLKHVSFVDKNIEERERMVEVKSLDNEGQKSPLTRKKERFDLGIPVVIATIGFLINFEDVYRVWAFVSRFLDADFVEKERWRYMAINQTTVEV